MLTDEETGTLLALVACSVSLIWLAEKQKAEPSPLPT